MFGKRDLAQREIPASVSQISWNPAMCHVNSTKSFFGSTMLGDGRGGCGTLRILDSCPWVVSSTFPPQTSVCLGDCLTLATEVGYLSFCLDCFAVEFRECALLFPYSPLLATDRNRDN